MKKIVFCIGFVIIFMTVNAQWSKSSQENNLISPAGAGNTLTAIGKTSDDMMYVSWNSNNIAFNTTLQLMDKDGNAVWENGGILVSNHLAPTWTSGYDICVSSDDCAIIALSDGRNYSDGNGFRPVVYKINKKGEFVWGKDGVQVPYENNGGVLTSVCSTNTGNVIVGFTDIASAGKCLRLTKFSSDGAILWSGLSINLGTECNLIACGKDDFILTYYITSGSGTTIMAQRYNSNGDAVWGEPVVIDNTGAVEPKISHEVCADGADGIIVMYKVTFSTSEMYTKLQHVSADGALLMGIDGVHASETYGVHGSGRLDVNVKRGEIFVLERFNNLLLVNKLNMYGEYIWNSDGITFVEGDVFGYMTCGISSVDDGSAIFSYTKNYQGSRSNLLASRIDDKGEFVWRDVFVCDANAQRAYVVCTPFFNNQVCMFWADTRNGTDPYGYGEIYGQNISLDGKLGVITVGINDMASGSDIKVYPNPTKDFISVDSSSNTIESVSITDLSGRLMLNVPCYNGNIDVRGFNAGIYLVKVRTSNGDFVNKVIIK